jgi:hypothetical protein
MIAATTTMRLIERGRSGGKDADSTCHKCVTGREFIDISGNAITYGRMAGC